MKIELSHDLLAKKIHEKASAEDKMLLRIRKFIQERFNYFRESKALLSLNDINYISPYLDKLSLEPHETRFIRRSKDRIWWLAGAAGLAVLSFVGVIFFFINRTNKIELKSKERMAAQLAKYEEISAHAQELSSALTASREGLNATQEELKFALLALQERNDTLVNSYATFRVQHDYSIEQLQNDLKIAQSSKLSELAASLVSLNKAYSFRLATKAWQLNPENQQAMNTLYRLASISTEGSYSKQRTYTIIKKYTSRWGELSEKEMTAIFHPKNEVTAKEDIAVEVKKNSQSRVPPPTSPMKIPTQEVHDKIQKERQQIQEKVKRINTQQQKIRDSYIQQSK